ncbi:MAG: lamin tail domain-containing protein [Candidatus Krumholzibacteriota bacterium]|nr:lamin tail domain-containing protein [Candidatus Krumholzibacteriota bacterium]
MRIIPLLIMSILYLPLEILFAGLNNQVVINELYYDHPGSDEGWEFIELFNNSSTPVDLSGYFLEAIDGRTGDATLLWEASEMLYVEPEGIVLIAGGSRSVPDVMLLRGSIENGPDGIRLCIPGIVIDRLGYGEHESIDIYETLPACDVREGISLARKPDGCDTDNNLDDFVQAIPTPGRKNFFDHDLEITLKKSCIILCKNKINKIEIEVNNSGLNRFVGPISVQVFDGPSLISEIKRADIDIFPGDGRLFEPALFARPIPSDPARVILTSEIDENHHNDTSLVSMIESPSDVVINEIMYRPYAGRAEWIELYNRTYSTIDISGWTLRDAAGRVVSTGVSSIGGRSYIIIPSDRESFIDQYQWIDPELVADGPLPVLNDNDQGEAAEMIELRDGEGGLIEKISYRALLGDERGRSIERITPDICSMADGGIWHRSAMPSGGSPACANSSYVESDILTGKIDIDPNPFDLMKNSHTVISGLCRKCENGINVMVYDLRGILVRRIFSERGGAKRFSCRWDGRSLEGRSLSPGIYICVVEYTGSGGSVCRREKACVILSRSGR